MVKEIDEAGHEAGSFNNSILQINFTDKFLNIDYR